MKKERKMPDYFLHLHEIKSLDIGDRIKFRAATRWGDRKVWRKVNGFHGSEDKPTVRFGGWPEFVVRHHEIVEIEKAINSDKGE